MHSKYRRKVKLRRSQRPWN